MVEGWAFRSEQLFQRATGGVSSQKEYLPRASRVFGRIVRLISDSELPCQSREFMTGEMGPGNTGNPARIQPTAARKTLKAIPLIRTLDGSEIEVSVTGERSPLHTRADFALDFHPVRGVDDMLLSDSVYRLVKG